MEQSGVGVEVRGAGLAAELPHSLRSCVIAPALHVPLPACLQREDRSLLALQGGGDSRGLYLAGDEADEGRVARVDRCVPGGCGVEVGGCRWRG